MTKKHVSPEEHEAEDELVIVEVSPKADEFSVDGGAKSISLWNKLSGKFHEYLPKISEDAEKELRSKLQKQTIENEHKKQEIESLREQIQSNKATRGHEESLYQMERDLKQISVRKAAVEVELLEEELEAKRLDRFAQTVEMANDIGLEIDVSINRDEKNLINLRTMKPKLIDSEKEIE